ncbi:phosphoglucosamine mutase [Neorickettsia helminthoeca str. Oregon]|uniref:Phosphoglucosamine mutase n=1 Tax=Neorickettsia helminthoeca str. Oregon TaxID=1286528 RepID=X5HMD7_9RICK|nr:phosphoglucosamine mutase [Neorickettsia helminthoeca]AHX11625.1 phosphoglucosamine mutase [Neorickettsia helminthoeca str. Oregon]
MVKLFGTDGIRGRANAFPMSAESVLQVAKLAALRFRNYGNTAIIGKDTRLSGYVFESCFVAGLLSLGMNAIIVGPVPTPCVSMLTVSLRCAFGVMISASHNEFRDNGIKFFDHRGLKISTDDESFIEENFHKKINTTNESFGKAKRLDDVTGRYLEFIKRAFPSDLSLKGIKILLDCANGSMYKIAESVFWELGAEVVTINNAPNGNNINLDCGTMHTQGMQERVKREKAHIGIAFDGDGDRLVVADENGNVIDGDQLIASIVRLFLRLGRLSSGTVVLTVASSMALENFLHGLGLRTVRSNVGDREVLKRMIETGANLGGEPSGHIIIRDYVNTSDGLIAALQLLHLMVIDGASASEITANFTPIPRILRNVDLGSSDGHLKLVAAEQYISKNVIGDERIVLRKSGTENVIRIIGEGSNISRIEAIVQDLVEITSRTS